MNLSKLSHTLVSLGLFGTVSLADLYLKNLSQDELTRLELGLRDTRIVTTTGRASVTTAPEGN